MNQGNDDLLIEYLLEQGSMKPEADELDRRREMIEQLRGASQVPTDVRRTTKNGYVIARSPLEMLAPAIGQGIASYKEMGVNAAAKGLQEKRLAGIEKIRRKRYGQSEEPFQLSGPGVE